MIYQVIFTPEALEDIDAVDDYLFDRFATVKARQFVERLVLACKGLSLTPNRGTPYPAGRPGLRTIGFERRAVIFYAVINEVIEIEAISYRGREYYPKP